MKSILIISFFSSFLFTSCKKELTPNIFIKSLFGNELSFCLSDTLIKPYDTIFNKEFITYSYLSKTKKFSVNFVRKGSYSLQDECRFSKIRYYRGSPKCSFERIGGKDFLIVSYKGGIAATNQFKQETVTLFLSYSDSTKQTKQKDSLFFRSIVESINWIGK